MIMRSLMFVEVLDRVACPVAFRYGFQHRVRDSRVPPHKRANRSIYSPRQWHIGLRHRSRSMRKAEGPTLSGELPRLPTNKPDKSKFSTPSPSSPSPEFITLSNFLKVQGLVQTGGEAKVRIQSGEVCVNGEVETRRGRKLQTGDCVQIDKVELLVQFDAA